MRPHQLPQFAGRPVAGAIGHNRGVVQRNYAFMPPEGVLVSRLPHVEKTVARILAAPVLGAQFAQYVLEIEPGGGTLAPFAEDGVQHFYYALSGEASFAMTVRAATPSVPAALPMFRVGRGSRCAMTATPGYACLACASATSRRPALPCPSPSCRIATRCR